MKRFILMCAVCLLAARAVVAAPPATTPQEFQPLRAITLEDEPWANVLMAQSGPPRAGKPTEALRWPVEERPVVDSPALLRNWNDVKELRFWLHLDHPRDWKLNIILIGSRDGYFMAEIALDWTGWKQVTLPLSDWTKMRDADWSDVRRLGFRAQGYKQPPIEKDTIWWLDDFAVKMRPKTSLQATDSIKSNRRDWMELAKQGNPFLLLNARKYAGAPGEWKFPEKVPDRWSYRGIADRLLTVSYAACDEKSPHRGRADLIAHASLAVDFLTEQCSDEGWWWKPDAGIGDPNVNRFTLGPLLDAVRWLRQTPAGEAAWPRWEKKLSAAVDLQRRAYKNQVDWDWAAKAGGAYANQDLYYVLIMALSADLWKRPADGELARDMMRRVAANLLPQGGLKYIGQDNEAPTYHNLNVVILGRYLSLTADPQARQLLLGTRDYWPLTMTAQAFPEFWSDVWWKQTWNTIGAHSLVTIAGLSNDARNQWLMWRALERTPAVDAGMFDIYCAPFWTGAQAGQPMPEKFIAPDENIRGARGRSGDWYFGVTQGRGLRNTFVGGLITSPTSANPLRATFRGAHIDVILDEKREHGLWLSEINDLTGLAIRGVPPKTIAKGKSKKPAPAQDGRPTLSAAAAANKVLWVPRMRTIGAVAIGARYTLQPNTINGFPIPQTTPSPWRATQVWRAAADGIIGVVSLEATEDTKGVAVVGRLMLGPRPLVQNADGTWNCGPLKIKVFQSFGTIAAQAVAGYLPSYVVSQWPSLTMRQELSDGQAAKGARFTYAVWLGPETATPPSELKLLPADGGWSARWESGRSVTTLFNGERQNVEFPFVLPSGFPTKQRLAPGGVSIIGD